MIKLKVGQRWKWDYVDSNFDSHTIIEILKVSSYDCRGKIIQVIKSNHWFDKVGKRTYIPFIVCPEGLSTYEYLPGQDKDDT